MSDRPSEMDAIAFLEAVAANARNHAPTAVSAQPACALCRSTYTPGRSDSRYCSSACRQRAYRARKATA